jgi:hypothetical protein
MAKQMLEAFGESRKREPKKLHHIELMKGKSGGVIASHHYAEEPQMTEHKPEHHVFGPEDGDKLLAHVARHMGIPGAEEEEGEAVHKRKEGYDEGGKMERDAHAGMPTTGENS